MKLIKYLHKRYSRKQIYIGIAVFLMVYIPLIIYTLAPKNIQPETKSTADTDVYGESTFAQKPTPNPEIVTMKDTVKNVMELPDDEEPVIATITDPEQLKGQDFFENAKVGDKILMYKEKKLAVLYRMESGEIITYAELEFSDTEDSSMSAGFQTDDYTKLAN